MKSMKPTKTARERLRSTLTPFQIDIQYAVKASYLPARGEIQCWVTAALSRRIASATLTIRLVGNSEMMELNNTYRHQEKATNVLSFPCESPPDMIPPHLGDIVICAPVVEKEAQEQNKLLQAHWAHLTVHGLLHLLGWDHQEEQEAEGMECEEIAILNLLGFHNPYQGDNKPQ